MRAGDIIFVRGNGWLSGLIKEIDPGEFSHVAIAVSDTHIFEAQYYMRANIVPMHYDNFEIVPLNLTKSEIEKLKVTCQVLSGKWYDYIQAFGYLFRYLFGTNINNFNNPNYLICSEALSLILYLLDKTDEPMVGLAPNELFKEISKIT